MFQSKLSVHRIMIGQAVLRCGFVGIGLLGLAATANAAEDQAGAPVPANLAAQFDIRISKLEEDLRYSNGKLEESQHTVAQLKQQIERLSNDLDYRLSQIEKANATGAGAPSAIAPGSPPAGDSGAARPAAGAPTGLASPPHSLGQVSDRDVKAAGAPVDPEATPKDQYDGAIKLVVAAQYDQAEGALKAFIAKYPKDALTSNAQYWLAETFYARGNYNEAAAQFLAGYQKYPQGQKAPDSLLKLGLALGNLSKKPEACASYSRLLKEFPAASAYLKRRAGEEKQRLGCTA